MRQGILQDGRRHGEAQGQQPKKEEKKIKRKRAHDEWMRISLEGGMIPSWAALVGSYYPRTLSYPI
jgi:hypothetical protein